jgi:uncharacterized membrane protein YsdA (DUF1294 family)
VTFVPDHGGMIWLLAGLGLAAINIWTFVLFGWDKRSAVAGRRRIREADLLGLALVGGTPAAFLARRHYRHKTRKQPFSTILTLIAVAQVGGLIGVLVPI